MPDVAAEVAPAGATLRPVVAPDEIPSLSRHGLSAVFDPFLPAFARQVLGVGGYARLLVRGANVRGLLLFVPNERLGSVFARSAADLAALAATCGAAELYAELPEGVPVEEYDVWALELSGRPRARGLRHPVRAGRESDLPDVAALSGGGPPASELPWARSLWSSGDRVFLVDVGGRPVAAGWTGIAGEVGRLHSLVVHPAYRRLGIGADLLEARLRWLERAGVRRAISEVAESNVASQRIAERAGMRRSGRMRLARWNEGAPRAP
ncbi:MAG TPA: GNAT family N-acetyltransferase [Thermoplasmata archaeon]|nr:GNAT family N-acetyltransferase [Thermoplasmata archaeon]